MILTITDIQGLIGIAIVNNKSMVIQAMNTNGYPISLNISDDDLFDKVYTVFTKDGIAALTRVLSKVPVNRTALTQDQARALITRFQNPEMANAKFGDLVGSVKNFFGDLIGGSTIGSGPISNSISTAALSPGILAILVVIGVILIIIFRKSMALVIAIVALIMAVVLYGIFAKTVTTTVTGGSSTTHGGIGQAILTFLTGG